MKLNVYKFFNETYTSSDTSVVSLTKIFDETVSLSDNGTWLLDNNGDILLGNIPPVDLSTTFVESSESLDNNTIHLNKNSAESVNFIDRVNISSLKLLTETLEFLDTKSLRLRKNLLETQSLSDSNIISLKKKLIEKPSITDAITFRDIIKLFNDQPKFVDKKSIQLNRTVSDVSTPVDTKSIRLKTAINESPTAVDAKKYSIYKKHTEILSFSDILSVNSRKRFIDPVVTIDSKYFATIKQLNDYVNFNDNGIWVLETFYLNEIDYLAESNYFVGDLIFGDIPNITLMLSLTPTDINLLRINKPFTESLTFVDNGIWVLDQLPYWDDSYIDTTYTTTQVNGNV